MQQINMELELVLYVLSTATLDIHIELEKTIAEFKGTEAAIAFQSGFNCNMGAISAVIEKRGCDSFR